MVNETQKLASPPALRKRLKIFRVGEGANQGVFIRDEVLSEDHTLEEWQFFVLEVLFGCETFEQLSSVFADRFGKPLTVSELDELVTLVAKNKWFSPAGIKHALVVASLKRLEGGAQAANGSATPRDPGTEKQAEAVDSDSLPPGVQDALGMDESKKKKIWTLFDPRALLKLTQPLFLPLQHAIYLLPLLLVIAVGILLKYSGQVGQDFEARHQHMRLFTHLLVSLVTDNLLATWGTCLVAYHYRATVSAFGIAFHLWGLLPRFIAKIGHVRQLSRRERIWLHATPMLVRLSLLSLGVFTWFGFRSSQPSLSAFGLALMTASAISLLITANPLIKSNAYFLLCAYINEPFLRGKSSRTLLDRLSGRTYRQTDGDSLAAYAVASAAFVLIAIGVLLYALESFLEFHLGGPGIVVLTLITIAFVWGLILKLKRLDQFYQRTTKFEKWRERAIPDRKPGEDAKAKGGWTGTFAFRACALCLIGALFIPYRAEINAPFTVFPLQSQEITSPLSGLVEQLSFDGGDLLSAGTVIGRLSSAEDDVEMSVVEAKIAEQEAVIAELRSRPLPEHVQLAESKVSTSEIEARLSAEKLARLELLYAGPAPEVIQAERQVQLAERQVQMGERNLATEITRTKFSGELLERMTELNRQKAASLDDLEEARRDHEVNVARVEEQRASIEVMRATVEVMLAEVEQMKADALDELENMRREHAVNLATLEEDRANLTLVKVGAKPEEIASAEAKLRGLKEQRDYHAERIGHSIYTMPFDGTLVATRLKEKIGSYIEKGEILATVEDNGSMLIQLDVQESDIRCVSVGDTVRARLPAFFDNEFLGRVTLVESTVSELPLGPVVRVTVQVENADRRLKTGMAGFAKIEDEVQPVWRVLTPALSRFIRVEVWSWLP